MAAINRNKTSAMTSINLERLKKAGIATFFFFFCKGLVWVAIMAWAFH